MPTPDKNINNCDGCQRGLVIKDGDHYDNKGKIVMGCTKSRYQKEEKCTLDVCREHEGMMCDQCKKEYSSPSKKRSNHE